MAVAGAPEADPLARLRADPDHAGLLLDFDGTLAPIVDDPDQARPLDGVVASLQDLSRRYHLVAVLSGRPIDFLAPALPPDLVLSGIYGLEVQRDGRRQDHPQAGSWREVIDDVVAHARARGPEGMLVEPKGLSLTLHYRTQPELADAVVAWASEEAARSGLRARAAKMSVELHPPIDADKGTAVDALVADLSAVGFVGDDVGDLPAFDALDRFERGGGHAVRVAVGSTETDPALLERADLVVDGPAGVLDLLRSL